jgi:D-glycero-D-manno-heptose 1,7-bisphosphate phosphatase
VYFIDLYQCICQDIYSEKEKTNMKKLIILDKDGTLVEPLSGSKFVQSPEDQRLLPGVMSAIQCHREQRHILVIASNQGGVAAGHKSLGEAIKEMKYCLTLCEALVEAAFFCPNYDVSSACLGLPENDCCLSISEVLGWEESLRINDTGYFRKPGPGLLLFAMQQYDVSPQDCLMVGDRPEDEQAAQVAGVAFQWAVEWRGKCL